MATDELNLKEIAASILEDGKGRDENPMAAAERVLGVGNDQLKETCVSLVGHLVMNRPALTKLTTEQLEDNVDLVQEIVSLGYVAIALGAQLGEKVGYGKAMRDSGFGT